MQRAIRIPAGERSEAPTNSPMLPPQVDRKPGQNGFRRCTPSISGTLTSLNQSENSANLGGWAKTLQRSGLSTFSAAEENERVLQSFISESEDDAGAFVPLGTVARDSVRIVESAAFSAEESQQTTSTAATTLSSSSARTSGANLRSRASGALPSATPKHSPAPHRKASSRQTSEELAGLTRVGGEPVKTQSSARLRFSERLNKDIELSRELSQCEVPPALPAPVTLRATEVENAVSLEFSGVRCCPLMRRSVGKMIASQAAARGSGAAASEQRAPVISAAREEDINLSPFKTWDFVRFLDDGQDSGATTNAAAEAPKRNTLCLDLDETLVHTSIAHMPDADAIVEVRPNEGGADGTYQLFVKYRPFLREFLVFALKHYEVVIFTASKKYYAKAILARLQSDMGDIFSFYAPDDEEAAGGGDGKGARPRPENSMVLLHRDHCTPTNAGYVKDLFLLGRDLRRCFIIDNNVTCGSFQPFNFLHVKDFTRREEEVAAGSDAEAAAAQAGVKKDGKAMDQQRLKELKGAVPNARASMSVTVSTYFWEDSEDDVLLRLISADHAILVSGKESQYSGLLYDLASTTDVPQYLLDSLIRSKQKASHGAPTDVTPVASKKTSRR